MGTLAPTRDELRGSGGAEPPPATEEERGGGGRGWVELVRAVDDIDAHLLAGRLEHAGIETSTLVDRGYPGAFLYGGHNPWAPVAILVRRFQLQDAQIALAELSYEGPDASILVAAPAGKVRRRALLWWISAIGLALFFTGVGLAASIERCERAGLCKSAELTP